ncbi:hypothetical protein ACWEF6_21175 [Amycolatopsis sp. NPDC004772]
MKTKLIFLALVTLVALVLSAIGGAGAVAICYLAGLTGSALIVVCGGATAAVFTGVMALAGLAAKLFFP